MSAQAVTEKTEQSDTAALEFVQALAAELSSGKVELPSFPDVAVRVRRVLAEERASIDQIARVVGSEPALAAKLLKMANSAVFSRSEKRVTDLRTAINRMGHNMVRTAAISFAMAQIRSASKLKGLEGVLDDLWRSSTHVAALSFLIADRCTRRNADEAMLTGLLHGIGKLYILTRAEKHPMLFVRVDALNTMIRDWHAQIGKAILENWEFSEEMCEAVGTQDDPNRPSEESEPADLRDVIAVAIMIASFAENAPGTEIAIEESPAAARLALNPTKIAAIVRDCAVEIASLREALGA